MPTRTTSADVAHGVKTGIPLTRFSVIIPCRNAAAYIDTALGSVRAQTIKAHEIIVIDDGSTDGSGERVEAHPDVVLLRTDGLGAPAARNAGIDAASGDYLAFLDADDRWLPEHLARAGALIEASHPAGLINHRIVIAHETGELLDQSSPVPALLRAKGLAPFIEFYRRYRHFTGMSACVARTDRARRIGGFDPAFPRRHDIEFWMRLIAGEDWLFDPEPTTLYQAGTPGSLSTDVIEGTQLRLDAFSRHAEELRGNEAYDEFMLDLARRALRQSFGTSEAGTWQAMLALSDPFLPRRARLGWRLVRGVPQSRKLLAALDML
jgi:glycosyltransferase involved in cell wall biosynthesis